MERLQQKPAFGTLRFALSCSNHCEVGVIIRFPSAVSARAMLIATSMLS